MARQLCAAGVVWSWAFQISVGTGGLAFTTIAVNGIGNYCGLCFPFFPGQQSYCQRGFDRIARKSEAGLSLLMQKLEVNPIALDGDALDENHSLFECGRLEIADVAMKILFPVGDLEQQVDHLIQLNQKRRTISSKIIQDVENKNQDGFKFVLSGDDWPVGVLSSVASRISNDRGTPIVLAAATEGVSYEARSGCRRAEMRLRY